MAKTLRVLIVEDNENHAELLAREIRRAKYEIVYKRVDTAEDMERALDTELWDLIICDYMIPNFGGPEALEIAKKKGLDLPFIVVSGQIGEEKAVEILKAGAHDFIIKGRFARLVPAVERELHMAEVRRQEKESQERINFQAHVLSQVNEAVIATDNNGCITYLNPAAERLYDARSSDMLGHPLRDLYECEWQKPEDEELAKNALEEKGVWRGEIVHVKKSTGRRICVESSLSILRNLEHEPIGTLVVVHTVSPIGI